MRRAQMMEDMQNLKFSQVGFHCIFLSLHVLNSAKMSPFSCVKKERHVSEPRRNHRLLDRLQQGVGFI